MTPNRMDELASELLSFVIDHQLPARDVDHLTSAARILHHHAKHLRVQQEYGRLTKAHPNYRR